jgi:hypothetical protein
MFVLADKYPVKLPHSASSPPDEIVAKDFVTILEVDDADELEQVVMYLH